MKEGPDIARIAALIGDPARANMLTALMSGKALTAGELAQEAGVTVSTGSSHLGKLAEGGLVTANPQGRHRYFRLSGHHIANLLEQLMGVATQSGHLRTRTGPRDAALREARVCYNHLAGRRGVQMFDSLAASGALIVTETAVDLTAFGTDLFDKFGIDLGALHKGRTPLCRPCLDWSARRHHLAGSLGRAMLSRMIELEWVKRTADSRAIRFTATGASAFDARFPLPVATHTAT